jgi:hypothetical protein
LIGEAADVVLIEAKEACVGEDGVDAVLQLVVSDELVDKVWIDVKGGEDVVEGEVVGLEGGVPEEEVPLEVQDDLINGVVLLVHDLLSDLFEEEAEGDALVKGLPPQQLRLEVDDLVEDVTVLRPTHLRQLLYLEDVQQVLEGQEFELLPEVLPQVLLREKDD